MIIEKRRKDLEWHYFLFYIFNDDHELNASPLILYFVQTSAIYKY